MSGIFVLWVRPVDVHIRFKQISILVLSGWGFLENEVLCRSIHTLGHVGISRVWGEVFDEIPPHYVHISTEIPHPKGNFIAGISTFGEILF